MIKIFATQALPTAPKTNSARHADPASFVPLAGWGMKRRITARIHAAAITPV